MPTNAETLARAAQYYQAGRLAAAEQLCRQVLQAEPGQAKAYHLLGLLAHQAGRVDEALDCYRQALRLRPDLAEVHNCLAAALAARGQNDGAMAHFQEALRLKPDSAETHNNLGTLLRVQERWAEAEASYRQAVRWHPDFTQAHANLGLVLVHQGMLEAAADSFQTALNARPDFLEARVNLADALRELGRWPEAEASYRAALRLRADLPEVHNALGGVLTEQRRYPEALASLQHALYLRPDLVGAHHNLAYLFLQRGRLEEAEASFRDAVHYGGVLPEPHSNLGLFLADQGRLPEALACFREAVRLGPQVPSVYSNFLLMLHYPDNYDPETTFAEHVRWGRHFEERGARSEERDRSPSLLAPRSSLLNSNRRLRIGYVSGDFLEHVMGRYSAAVVAAHDRSQVEVFCYANVKKEDALTQRIRASADHWRSLVGLSDARAAQVVRADRIDVLVDLAGHTADNRLGVFIHRPAPVQVTHCGYPDTTGLTAMDYRLTDPSCDPLGQTERFYTEQVVCLPEAHWCFAPPATPEVGSLPAHEAGAVTFASFNKIAKVTEAMIALWARLLHALPGARLIVQTGAGRATDERLRAAFAGHGVAAERVTLAPRLSSQAYYERFGEVDICLDTYPYTGCNTTADALWMGVPVVTRAGPTCVTRLGVSALVLAGLDDLVTDTPDAYVETAVQLARDLPRLRELRAQLRDRVRRTLGDVERFTRQLETAYREMWRRYCQMLVA